MASVWLNLKVKGAPHGVVSPFHFAAEVLPDIEPIPSQLLVRAEELSDAWSRRLIFVFREKFDGRFTIAWSNPSLAALTEIRTIAKDDRSLSLYLAPKVAGVMARNINEPVELLLQLPSGGSCKVPVYLGEASFEAGLSPNLNEKVGNSDP